MPGVSTAALDIATTLDEVIGNVAGTTKRLAMARLVSMVVAQAGPSYATRAALFADLAWPSGYLAWVRADTTTVYNGVYKKAGLPGAGAWTKLSDLPTSSVEAAELAEMRGDVEALQAFAARTDNPHGVTKAQVGLGNVNNTADADKPVSTPQAAAIAAAIAPAIAHFARTDNPHGVTKAQVGLGNVNNTADVDKPVSTPQAAAIAAAVGPAAIHAARTDNPHGVTKAQVGLGNVDNTPDATKPVSAPQAAAIAAEAVAREAGDSVQRHGRPEYAWAFIAEVDGDGRTAPGFPGGDVLVDGDLGTVLSVGGSQFVAPRQPYAIYPGRLYRADWSVKRVRDADDPFGDAVVLGVRWLTAAKAGIGSAHGTSRPHVLDLRVADGVQRLSATFSVDLVADFAVPSGAIYARPFVQVFGGSAETVVAQLEIIEIFDAVATAPPVPDLLLPRRAQVVVSGSGLQSGEIAEAGDWTDVAMLVFGPAGTLLLAAGDLPDASETPAPGRYALSYNAGTDRTVLTYNGGAGEQTFRLVVAYTGPAALIEIDGGIEA